MREWWKKGRVGEEEVVGWGGVVWAEEEEPHSEEKIVFAHPRGGKG